MDRQQAGTEATGTTAAPGRTPLFDCERAAMHYARSVINQLTRRYEIWRD